MRTQTISLSGRRKKKLERQVEKYLSALQTHHNDYKIHIDLGDTYAELEDMDNGVEAYYTAIDLLRQAPTASKTRSLTIELYEKIIQMSPEAYRAYIELSEEYITAGQKEKAFRFLLTSAKKAYEEENYELALECYNQAIAKGRTNPHIVERCTELYIKLGRTQEAMQNYLQIGDMYAQDEKNIEALEYYKKACALEPDNPELLLKVARMYNAMAWTENAASELVKVGEYYEHNHEYTEALRYYNYSVRLDPENERAQEGRSRINQSPSLDGLIIPDDTAESRSETPQADVLEQLDQLDETLENISEPPTVAQFELTPLDATLTFEESGKKNASEAEDQAAEMEMIVLEETIEAEGDMPAATEQGHDSETLLLDDDHIIDDQQMLSNLSEETLWFSRDHEDNTGNETNTTAEGHFPRQRNDMEDSDAENQSFINLFMLDDADDNELLAPGPFSITGPDDVPDFQETKDRFSLTESADPRSPAHIEPNMLPMNDDEPLDDLQPFITEADDDLLNEAETRIISENRNHDYAEDESLFDETVLPFGGDVNALPPAAESLHRDSGTGGAQQSNSSTSSISLEDWIIDLKEDELVELALEEALREQEQEAAANWEELLGLTPSQESEASHDSAYAHNGDPLSLPEQAPMSYQGDMTEPSAQFNNLGTTGDIIDIQAETRGKTVSQDRAQKEFPVDEDRQASEGPQNAISDEESTAIHDTIWLKQTTEESLELHLDDDALDEENSAFSSNSDNAADSFNVYLVDEEQQQASTEEDLLDEDEIAPGEIVLEIDNEIEDLDDFVAGAGMFLHDEETAEDDEKIGVSLEEDASLKEQATDDDLDGFVEMPISHDISETESDEEESETERAVLPEIQEDDVATPISPQTPESVDMQDIFEESEIDEIFAEHELSEPQELSEISSDIQNLRRRIDDLEQQLERTEEEKYFLQERFAAQISQHKAHEESLQREIADVYRDKAELEKQLQTPGDEPIAETPVPVAKRTAGPNAAGFDNDRYDAIIGKITQKKTRIQTQLHTLLKKREESGRYLNQELDVLAHTKERLQHNLEYIQQVKTRVEEKVNTELRQAQEHVAALTKTSKALETQLQKQRQQEQELRQEFAVLRQEKDQLQSEYADTLGVLQHEKTNLEQQLRQTSQAKQTVERALKKKLQTLHRSYQQLKGEYTTVIELKDAQLAENAQKLSDVTGKYKKLERILAEIRKERVRLNTRLHEEIAARESLEEKLVSIETHVDALDAQESKLVKQLGHELERRFSQEQHVSDKFQLSLDELEGLLALQEHEIHMLEAI